MTGVPEQFARQLYAFHCSDGARHREDDGAAFEVA